MLTTYEAGTISTTNNSQIIEGIGTSWLTYVKSGDTISIDGVNYTIAEIQTINKLLISAPYTGDTAQNLNYIISINTTPAFDFAQAKAKKLAEISAAYLNANSSFFTYAGKDYAANDNAKFNLMAINGYVATNNALPASFPNVWQAIDGSIIAILTVADFNALYAAMVAQGSNNFIKLAMLEAQINALPNTTTQAELDLIVW